MKHWGWMLMVLVLLAGCQAAEPPCPEGAVQYLDAAALQALPQAEAMGGTLEVDGSQAAFDQVIHGALCNAHLAGKVYIACDIQIAAWQDAPNFLDGCDFMVEEGSEITVAAHNNAVYFKGCGSCHASEGQK